MAYQIKKWLSRDTMEQEKDPGLYRITSQAKPVFEFGRWRPANAGGYQIHMYDHDVRLLLGEEFELEPGELMELAISKYDFHAAMAQKMTEFDNQVFSLTTVLSDSMNMLLVMVRNPVECVNFTARFKRMKNLFGKILASHYTPKEADTLFPERVKELNEEGINPYEGQTE